MVFCGGIGRFDDRCRDSSYKGVCPLASAFEPISQGPNCIHQRNGLCDRNMDKVWLGPLVVGVLAEGVVADAVVVAVDAAGVVAAIG